MTQQAREQRDAEKAKVRSRYQKKISNAQAALRQAEAYVSEQKSQFWVKIFLILSKLVAMLFGGKSRSRGVSSSSVGQAMRERGQQSRAQQRLEEKRFALEELEQQLQSDLTQLEIDYEPSQLELERLEVALRKSDTTVDPIRLVWLPWQIDVDGTARPAY
jgi:hypothetical protein